MAVSHFFVGFLLIASANAFWRMPCTKPVLDGRVDPIVNPGKASGHAHTIMGSGGMPLSLHIGQSQSDPYFQPSGSALRFPTCAIRIARRARLRTTGPHIGFQSWYVPWLVSICMPDMTS